MDQPKKEKKSHPPSPKGQEAFPVEEEYSEKGRKASRIERKRLSAKDRSKFKKTDKKKYEEGLKKDIQARGENKDLFQGRVLSITSQGAFVDHEGTIYTCFLRGLLKKEKTQYKNIITVGDFVFFKKLPDHEGLIVEVKPRTSTLSRADNLARKKEQLIAANIDQVLITSSVVSPPLKPFLIDRYIIASRKGNMEPIIVINKMDLLKQDPEDTFVLDQKKLFEECEKAYNLAGIPLVSLSAQQGAGLDRLKELMRGKASVFSGQSGTGKSSLINRLTGLQLPVGDTVQKTRKGSHTTTQARLVPLDCGGWCIDTPGIKSFGVWDLSQQDIESYFTEIQEIRDGCKFPDCTHTHEKSCQVIAAYEKGNISPLRYKSYVSLLTTIQKEHRRR